MGLRLGVAIGEAAAAPIRDQLDRRSGAAGEAGESMLMLGVPSGKRAERVHERRDGDSPWRRAPALVLIPALFLDSGARAADRRSGNTQVRTPTF